MLRGGGRFSMFGFQQASVCSEPFVSRVSRHSLIFQEGEIGCTSAVTSRTWKCRDSGAFRTSCSLLPSAKTGLCARSSVIDITGNNRTRMQPRTSSPRPRAGTKVESDRRRQRVQLVKAKPTMNTHTRLSSNSTMSQLTTNGAAAQEYLG